MHAIRNSRDSLVQFLIKEGADVNYRTTNGTTPLHVAVSSPNESGFSTTILKYLLTVHYIKLNVFNNEGRTPLMIAIRHGRYEAVEILTNAGSNVHLRMFLYGSTAAHLCFDMFNPCQNAESAKCLKALMNCGLSPDAVYNGETPLFYAIRKNNIPALKVLISANCNLNVSGTTWGVDKEPAKVCGHEVTPIVLAYNFLKKRSVELLVDAGCIYHHLWWMLDIGSTSSPNALSEWFRERLSHPRSLKNLCRYTIRAAIGHIPHKKVQLLSVPTAMQDYILMKDLLD